jgi:nicotinamidase/pyrazinamidase
MQSLERRTFLRSGARPGGVAAPGRRATKLKPGATALIVVDVQNCFVDGGTLP